jgi:hypothetical protein
MASVIYSYSITLTSKSAQKKSSFLTVNLARSRIQTLTLTFTQDVLFAQLLEYPLIVRVPADC